MNGNDLASEEKKKIDHPKPKNKSCQKDQELFTVNILKQLKQNKQPDLVL
jgi:hypothetical protein